MLTVSDGQFESWFIARRFSLSCIRNALHPGATDGTRFPVEFGESLFLLCHASVYRRQKSVNKACILFLPGGLRVTPQLKPR